MTHPARRIAPALAVLGAAALLAVGGLAGRTLAQSGPPSRIAFVDMQRVLARSAAGVAARESLEREKAAMQKQVDAQKAEVDRLRDEIEKKGQLLSAEARREKQDAYDRKVRDVSRLVDDLQKELRKKEQEALAKVLQDVQGVVQKLGKERGYTMIVERRGAAVVYGAAEADLTDETVRVYDESRKAGGR
jgi:outer membrane protein